MRYTYIRYTFSISDSKILRWIELAIANKLDKRQSEKERECKDWFSAFLLTLPLSLQGPIVVLILELADLLTV